MINQAVGAACVGERGGRTGFRSAPELDAELQVPPPVLGETGTDEEIVELTAILRLDRREELTERRLERVRSEEHTSELQSLMRISYAVFCLKKKKNINTMTHN